MRERIKAIRAVMSALLTDWRKKRDAIPSLCEHLGKKYPYLAEEDQAHITLELHAVRGIRQLDKFIMNGPATLKEPPIMDSSQEVVEIAYGGLAVITLEELGLSFLTYMPDLPTIYNGGSAHIEVIIDPQEGLLKVSLVEPECLCGARFLDHTINKEGVVGGCAEMGCESYQPASFPIRPR